MRKDKPVPQEPKGKTFRDRQVGSLYETIGGMETCRRLSERFHQRVDQDPELRPIFPKDMRRTSEHLALFLAELLGGPAEYTTKRGKNSLVCRHAHLPIGPQGVDRWMENMLASMEEAGLPEEARPLLCQYFHRTAPTLSDPFIDYYHLPLDRLRARLEECPALAKTCDNGRSLVCAAAGAWDLPRMQLLLEYGADPNVMGGYGHGPLYHAANTVVSRREDDGRAVVELLIRSGAEVNRVSGPVRVTALHMAARRDNVGIGEALLAAGADIEARDIKGETPLRRAVNCSQEEFARMLLRHGADPLSRDRQGRTPLDAARTVSMRHALEDALVTMKTSC